MRSNLFMRLYPELKPKLEEIAVKVAGNCIYGVVGTADLMQEGWIAVYRCESTNAGRPTKSYLIHRAKYAMVHYLASYRQKTNFEFQHDFTSYYIN